MASHEAALANATGPRPGRPWLALAGFVALCLVAGGLGSVATTPNIATWYEGLNKPWFNPPNGVFPVVWTALYLLMAVSAWLVWRTRTVSANPAAARESTWMLTPFYLQLGLNVAWSFAFFGAHSPFLGLVVIANLLAVIAWTMASFWQLSRVAVLLLAPYFAWVSFASLLNAAVNALN